jgi:hypothetical protein
VDNVEEHELRTWADALCASADAERRAMSRAILMLLGQIDALKGELEQAQRESHEVADFELEPPAEPAHQPPQPEVDANDDPLTISLRERLRAMTRGHD